MGSESGMFWILREMLSWHRIMLLPEIGVKIEGCALKAADRQQPNKERAACFWFLVYGKACACVSREGLQKLFCWSWCLALNQCRLEVEERDGGYWQERSMLGGVSRSCWLWGGAALWVLWKDVTKDGPEGKGACPACSCVCLAARIDQKLCLGKMSHCWLPYGSVWEWAEGQSGLSQSVNIH